MKSDFGKTKSLFNIPKNLIYLDGNSLGPPTKESLNHLIDFVDNKWAKLLVRGWNEDNWISKPISIGDRIATLVGAQKGSIIVGDTLSIKTYQALFSAIKLQRNRKIVLSDSGNFPSDLYIAKGLIDSLKSGYQLKLVEPEEVMNALNDEVAVLFLSEVDYRTSRKHNMAELTKQAKKVGALTIWDIAHSVGILDLALEKVDIDFAVGCTYKYLNGGPGSPAFLYAAPRLQNNIDNPIKGWLGHSSPFAFEKKYTPRNGIDKMQIGTPSIIAKVALEAGLDILESVTVEDIREQCKKLTQLFIEQTCKNCPELNLLSPKCPNKRGAHVAFEFKNGYPLIQCLIKHNVIGDFRNPNLMRFGFNPLYINEEDVLKAAEILTDVMETKKWNKSEFKIKSFVT